MSNQKCNSSKVLAFSILQSTAGLSLLLVEPNVTHIETIAFAILSVGSLLSVLIYNHINNPIASDKSILNMSYAFVIYSGICIWLVHNEIIVAEKMLIPLSIVIVLGFLISLIPKTFDIQTSDI